MPDAKIYTHRNCINHFIEAEPLYSLLKISPHADPLVWIKALCCTLQINARPLLDKRRGEGTQ